MENHNKVPQAKINHLKSRLEIPIQGEGTLHRVPPQLRENKKHIYVPVVFPLGPYHHDKEKFARAEQLKIEALDKQLDENSKGLARTQFLARTQEIRKFYEGVSELDDNSLADMVLRDACFVAYYMEATTGKGENKRCIIRHLGLSGFLLMFRDFLMLENQVPLWAIKLLIRLTLLNHDDGKVEELIWKFVNLGTNPDNLLREAPWAKEPVHLLEFCHRALLRQNNSTVTTNGSRNALFCKIFKWKRSWDNETGDNFPDYIYPFRSVMDLKAKGILVRPSSKRLSDIRFESYWFYGELLLPTVIISSTSKVLYPNLIALEMSPNSCTNAVVVSYVDFMQSIIENPKDVKELREKRVLFSKKNDEEVMNIIKELDIHEDDGDNYFKDVRMQIDRHCRSKWMTWVAELGYTYFHSPWSAMALISAAVILILTFLQTIYSKKQLKK